MSGERLSIQKYIKLPPIHKDCHDIEQNSVQNETSSDPDKINCNVSNNKTPDTPRPKTDKATRKRFARIGRGMSPLKRFRLMGKMVIQKILPKLKEGESATGAISRKKAYLSFDKNYFKANLDKKGLTTKEKHILKLEPKDRKEDDLNILKGVVSRLKCFEKYTPKVRHDLSRVVFYMTLDAGRYIIKQGHDGFSFYFVVSGKVQVRITETDPVTSEKVEFAVAEMSEGSSFGELALLHNCKRTATIVCIANGSQFLRVDRFDFEQVLHTSTVAEWQDRLTALKSLPCMIDYADEDYVELNTHCRLVEYLPGHVLMGNTDSIDNTFFFLCSGVCEIVREISMVREIMEFNLEKLHLLEDLSKEQKEMLPNTDLRKRRNAANNFLKPVRQLWSVGEIGKGFYCGLGENLKNTYIIAKSKVEVLQIRRIKFIKNGRWRLIDGMRAEIDKAMPTNQQLLQKYKKESNWDIYKQLKVRDVTKHRKAQCNTKWEDVPNSIRDNSIRAGSLQKSFYRNYVLRMKNNNL